MWWSKHMEDFPKSPFESGETANVTHKSKQPIPPSSKPEYYYVRTVFVHQIDKPRVRISNVIDIKENGNFITFVIDDANDDGPERMINKGGIVYRHHRSISFSTMFITCWEVMDSDLRINEDGE